MVKVVTQSIRSQLILGLFVLEMSNTIRDGRGSYFFTGRGGARPKIYGAGTPPLPTVRGGAGKGSKSAGRGGAGVGNILRASAD